LVGSAIVLLTMEHPVEVELRKKNQLTWPERIARRMDTRPGSRLLIDFDEERQEARVRVLRDSYAGILHGTYGSTPEEIAAYLEEERRSWHDE
jgi:bifunctional DNA-binding transcriptional regulator/antitoxin component of YhaV-PrlF toxin-antitoxin module